MSDVAAKTPKTPKPAAKAAAGDRYVRVTLVRSLIGTPLDQRATAKGLGLRKPQSSAVLKATPAVEGMIRKIVWALKVEAVEKP
jgi:large subunit ribosomal protein L30